METPNRWVRILCTLILIAATSPLSAQTRAEVTAKRLFDSRTSSGDAAAQLQRNFRADDGEVVRLLNYAGYPPAAIASASTRTLRADGRQTATYMARAGLKTTEIASGLARGARITGRRALDALVDARLSGVMTPNVYRAVSAGPSDITGFLRARGESSTRAARDLVSTHRLGSKEVARELMAEYAVVDVGRALKDHFRMDGSGIRDFLEEEGVDPPLADSALLDLGFEPEVPQPRLEYFYVMDYRLGASPGAQLGNPGYVVSRPAVLPAPHETDGVVWFQGYNLDRPETEVWGGITEGPAVQGVIRSREQVGFQERLEVYFPHFRGTGFRLTTDGGSWGNTTMRGIGYAPIEVSLFEEALEGLFVSVIGGGFQVQFGNAIINGSFEQEQENGIEVVVTRLLNDGFTVSTENAPQGVNVVVSIPFEEQGPEFTGTSFGYIPCWKCGETTVPKVDCPSLTLNCLSLHLGALFNSLGECANLEMWEETELLDTVGVPFVGDLDDATLDIRMNLGATGDGLWAGPTTFDFQSQVTVSTAGVDVSASDLSDYVSTRVTNALTASLQQTLSVYLVQGLRSYASILGWKGFRTLGRMPDGRLFATFEVH